MRLNIMVNKKVWMDCFGRGVPTEDVLVDDIRQLKARLDRVSQAPGRPNKQTRSRLCNSLQRHQKMLAAVKDGQPWAWMLYQVESCNTDNRKNSATN